MTLSYRTTILEIIKGSGPKCQQQICEMLHGGYLKVGNVIGTLVREKELKFVGWACDLGVVGVKPDAPMWAVSGTPNSPALLDGNRIACVACGGTQVYRTKRRMLECRTCNSHFYHREIEQEERPARKARASGSGHIAGRIEVGRGFRWWSGLV